MLIFWFCVSRWLKVVWVRLLSVICILIDIGCRYVIVGVKVMVLVLGCGWIWVCICLIRCCSCLVGCRWLVWICWCSVCMCVVMIMFMLCCIICDIVWFCMLVCWWLLVCCVLLCMVVLVVGLRKGVMCRKISCVVVLCLVFWVGVLIWCMDIGWWLMLKGMCIVVVWIICWVIIVFVMLFFVMWCWVRVNCWLLLCRWCRWCVCLMLVSVVLCMVCVLFWSELLVYFFGWMVWLLNLLCIVVSRWLLKEFLLCECRCFSSDSVIIGVGMFRLIVLVMV